MVKKRISMIVCIVAGVLCVLSLILGAVGFKSSRVGTRYTAKPVENTRVYADKATPTLKNAMQTATHDTRDTLTVQNDESGKKVTVTGGRYAFVLAYGDTLAIRDLQVDDKTLCGEGDGIWLSAATQDAEYASTEATVSAVTVEGSGDERTITARYEDALAQYTVTVTARVQNFTLDLRRVMKGETTLTRQAFPAMQFEQDAIHSVRWSESGSNFWVGGKASKLRYSLAAEDFTEQTRAKRTMDEINFELFGSVEDFVALAVTGTSSCDGVTPKDGREHARGRATEIDRAPLSGGKRSLYMATTLAAPGQNLQYASGDPDWGWTHSGQMDGGSVRPTGTQAMFKPQTFASAAESTVTLTFTPENYEDRFDMGEMYGIDEKNIAHAVNVYARQMLLGKNVGSAQEEPQFYVELPALQMHWNTALATLFRDDASMNTQKWALKNIAKFLMDNEGHIRSPYPGVAGNNWGHNYPSMQTNYVTAIVDYYGYTGDTQFALDMRDAAEKSMTYFANYYFDVKANLAINPVPNNPFDNKDLPHLWESHNDYWEKSIGKYNGLLTVEYYEALTKLAELEEAVYGDAAKATAYRETAAKVKAAFNKDKADGGCFVPEQRAFYYGSDNENVSYLPVQATAIRTGIVEGERAAALAREIERVQSNFDMRFHVMNVRDLKDASVPASQGSAMPTEMMVGENGGWYGAPDAEWYAAFPVLGDRGLIPWYINGAMEKYEITEFAGATCYKRDGVTPADDGWYTAMPNMALPVWGLYTYGYGFRSSVRGLDFAPFIDESMVGSVIPYRYRGTDVTATYHGLYDFTLRFDGTLPVQVRFLGQTAGKTYTVRTNGGDQTVTAGPDGSVTVAATAGRYTLVDPDAETDLVYGGDDLFAGNAVRPSSTQFAGQMTRFWAEQITDGETDGYWTPDGSDKAPTLTVVNGKRYVLRTLQLYTGTGKHSFVLEGSDTLDGGWKEIKTVTGVTPTKRDGQNVITVKTDASFRYWRIRFTNMKNADLKIYEIKAK